MRVRHHAHAAVALIAAYAIALQAVLLVFGGLIAGGGPAAAGQAICAHAGAADSGSAPSKPRHGCFGACPAGCCGSPTAISAPAASIVPPLPLARKGAGVVMAVAWRLPTVTGAHRSRAPPLG